MRLLTARLSRTLLPTLVLSTVAGLLAAPLLSGRCAPTPPRPGAESPARAARERALETYGRIP